MRVSSIKYQVSSISRGQSLFEVVISFAVVTIIIVALVILSTNSIRNSTFSRNNSLATRYNQELQEWLRGERDRDWEEFQTRTLIGKYCLKELSWATAAVGACLDGQEITGTSLKREVAFENIDVANIQVEVIVFWNDAQGLHEVRSITQLTDWRVR